MADAVKLDLPTDIGGWRNVIDKAKDIYWSARRNGKDENGALVEAVDDILADADKGRRSR